MVDIKSDLTLAQQYASDIATACQTLESIGEICKDSSTELDGNTSSHTAIDKASSLLSQVTGAVSDASEHLHSVASDFEAIDQSGADGFRGMYDKRMGKATSTGTKII